MLVPQMRPFALAAPSSPTAVPSQFSDASSANGRIWGTSIHGLFDQAGFRRGWLNRIRGRKGLSPISPRESELVATQLRAELDRWADHLERYVNMDAIYPVFEGQ